MLSVYLDIHNQIATLVNLEGSIYSDYLLDKNKFCYYGHIMEEYIPDRWDKYVGTIPEGLL